MRSALPVSFVVCFGVLRIGICVGDGASSVVYVFLYLIYPFRSKSDYLTWSLTSSQSIEIDVRLNSVMNTFIIQRLAPSYKLTP